MTKRVPLLALAIALVAGNAFLSDAASAQEAVRIEGTITDDGTGEPIEGATVRLADPSGSARETITGPDGAFAFAQVQPGEYTLAVRRLGYEVLSAPLEIGAQAPPRLDVRLQPQAIPLDPLEVGVEGRPPRLAESGFYERMEEGWGVFIEPEWIEANKRGFVRLADFMSTLQMRAPLPRCAKIPVYLDRRPIGAADGWGTSTSYSLNPAGTFRSPDDPPPTLLEELSVYDLGAAELYQPGSKIPFFAWDGTSMVCGAIILWSNWTAATAEIPKINVTLCESAGRPGEVTLQGVVEDQVTEVRLPAAHVFASYPRFGGSERVDSVVRTDSLGRFRLCDLPAGVEVRLATAYGPHDGDSTVVQAADSNDVELVVAVTVPSSIMGVVTNARTGRPLRQVTVVLVGTEFSTVANGSEGFAFTELTPGSYRVRASCVGFETSEQDVEVSQGGQASVALTLTPRARRIRRCTR